MSARGLRSIARDVEEGRIQGAEVAKKLEDAAAEVDALKGDRFIYRIVVVALGIVAVAAVIGTILVLLIGAGLFVRTLQQSQRADVGFDLEQGLFASLDLLPAGYEATTGTAFYKKLIDQVLTVPGVTAAGLARDIPLKLGGGSDTSGDIEGYVPAKDEEITLYYDRVSPGFLPALGVPLVEGRGFTDQDDAAHPNVVMINETMAKRYWKTRPAVGGRLHLGEWYTVVGIVKDVKYTTLNADPVAFVYLPLYAAYRPDTTLLVRTAGEPAAVIGGKCADTGLGERLGDLRDIVARIGRVVVDMLGCDGDRVLADRRACDRLLQQLLHSDVEHGSCSRAPICRANGW